MQREYIFDEGNLTEKEIYDRLKSSEFGIWNNRDRTGQYDEIEVTHSDGSFFRFCYAFFRFGKVSKGELLCVYPEHTQPAFFYLDDLSSVYLFKHTYTAKNTLKTTQRTTLYKEGFNPEDYDDND